MIKIKEIILLSAIIFGVEVSEGNELSQVGTIIQKAKNDIQKLDINKLKKINWNTFHSNLNRDNQNYDLVLYLLDFQWSCFGTVPSFFKYMIEIFKNVWWFEWEDRLSIEEDRLSIE